MSATTYSGLTWDHPRGVDALAAAAAAWTPADGSRLTWAVQPLEGFESHPIGELLCRHDLVVLDHPHLGDALSSGRLLPLEAVFAAEDIRAWQQQTIGQSMASYQHGGQSHALPLDVAALVMASDAARLPVPPDSWEEVLRVAARVPVALSLAGPHALSTWYALCLSLGEEPGGEQFVPETEALEALRIMAALYKNQPTGFAQANPIALLEAVGTHIALIPLVFGYVNYADPTRVRPARFSEAPRFGSAGRRGSVLGGTGIGLSTRRTLGAALLDHLRWLMRQDTQRGFIPAHNGQPSARVAWTDGNVNRARGNFYLDTLQTLQTAWVRPRFAGYVSFHNAASMQLRAWLHGGGSAAACLETLRTLWRTALHKTHPNTPAP